ncbi:MAG: ferritin-like domain-containing protein [Actinomycetota bacterium]|nr:ferritin-like domain-containing protein [Actinomycetota bacterium]
MEKSTEKLIQLLVEARTNELAMVQTLEAHLGMAKGGNYKTLVRQHLSETKRHADDLKRRLDDLGYDRTLLARGYEFAQNAVKQGLVLTKGPIDLIRGRTDVTEKMLRNAMDEVMTEGLEIGAYDAIESLARGLGDHVTADLAATIRIDEERMFQDLRKEIPALAQLVVESQIPSSERANVEPWPEYNAMTVEEIESRLRGAGESVALAVRNYEKLNKNRSSVISATERQLA